LALGLWVAAWAQSGNPWRDNLTRDDVIGALGEPKSSMEMGSKAVLEYDGGVMITLQNGVVTNIAGTVPAALRAGAASPAAAARAPTASVSAPVAAASGASAPVVATPVPAVSTTSGATSADGSVTVLGGNVTVVGANGTASATGSGSAVTVAPAAPVAPAGAGASSTAGKTGGAAMAAAASDDAMINDAANPTLPPEAAHMLQSAGVQMSGNMTIPGMGKLTTGAPPPPPQNPWVGFAIGLGTSTVFLIGILKLAFVRKEFPVIWRDIIAVAFLTALFYQTMDSLLAGNTFFDIAHFLQADQILAGILMLALIMKMTEVKQFHTAVGITISAMVVNTVVQFALPFLLM